MPNQSSKIFFEKIYIIYFCIYIIIGDFRILLENRVSHLISFTLLPILGLFFIYSKTNTRLFALIFFSLAFFFLGYLERNFHIEDFYRINVFIIIAMTPLIRRLIEKDPHLFTKIITKLAVIIMATVIIDYLLFIFLGFNFYNLHDYITIRAQGPYFDPNFLGLFSGAIFLIEYYTYRRKFILIISLFSLIISGSFTAIFFTLLCTRIKGISVKIIPFAAILFIPLFSFLYSYKNEITDITKQIIPANPSTIDVKLISLFDRFESIDQALKLIFYNFFGYGNKSLLEYLPRDPHNSFVGISFEYGVFSLILVLSPYFFLNKKNINSPLILFTSLMALFLNVHYSSIFIASFLAFTFDKENSSIKLLINQK